ncbi:unnamed protein product [Candidula unifasciata]|uniref:Anaphase-promoting complex subunit 16 n=1 Tax=Candidula unifasciata TaxID=100452 RepID=A0A8S3ZPX6_9EUPU|nr:unnamed protein product [Candidula unifasciata]
MARFEAAPSILGNIAFKKALFQSPSPAPETTKSTTNSELAPSASLIYKVQLQHDIDLNLHHIKKSIHIERLKNLRELSTKLQDDDWRYESAEKLTGLQ